MSSTKEALLDQLYQADVFKLGQYKLKSGQDSPIYIDFRSLISNPEILQCAVDILWQKVSDGAFEYDSVCGVPYAALPLAAGLCVKHKVPMLIRRREVKQYGTKKLIEGLFVPGQRCLIIEDVVTLGESVLETIEILKSQDLDVTDVVVLLDRQQGGRENLAAKNISLHSVFNLDEILKYLVGKGDVTEERMVQIKSILSMKPIENGSASQANTRLKLKDRSALSGVNSKTKQLIELMERKASNLCVSADLTISDDILACENLVKWSHWSFIIVNYLPRKLFRQGLSGVHQLVRKVGGEVCAVKIHSDIIEDFSLAFSDELKKLSRELDFLIIEDRKFADIGSTTSAQFTGGPLRAALWADFVTAHAVAGQSTLDGLRQGCEQHDTAVLLIAEMSSTGNLAAIPQYKIDAVELGRKNKDIVAGFVCQKRCLPNTDADADSFLYWSPGVNASAQGDGMGQQFRPARVAIERDLVDIVIVGRGIISAPDPLSAAKLYRQQAWSPLEENCI